MKQQAQQKKSRLPLLNLLQPLGWLFFWLSVRWSGTAWAGTAWPLVFLCTGLVFLFAFALRFFSLGRKGFALLGSLAVLGIGVQLPMGTGSGLLLAAAFGVFLCCHMPGVPVFSLLAYLGALFYYRGWESFLFQVVWTGYGALMLELFVRGVWSLAAGRIHLQSKSRFKGDPQ